MDSNMRSSSKSDATNAANISNSDDEEINFDDLNYVVDEDEDDNDAILFNCESVVARRNSSELIEKKSFCLDLPDEEGPVSRLNSPINVEPTSMAYLDSPVNEEPVDSPSTNTATDKKKNCRTAKNRGPKPKKKNAKDKHKSVESESNANNNYKSKSKLVLVETKTNYKLNLKSGELDSKVKTEFSLPILQLKVVLERIDLSRYRIGNSDRFSSHPICKSPKNSIGVFARNKNEVQDQNETPKCSSRKEEENSLGQKKIKPLKIKNTHKGSGFSKEAVNDDLSVVNFENSLKCKFIRNRGKSKKRSLLQPEEEMPPVPHTPRTELLDNSIDQLTCGSRSPSLESPICDKENSSETVKRRRMSSPYVKLKETHKVLEELIASEERATFKYSDSELMIDVKEVLDDLISSVVVVVDSPLKVDLRKSSKSRSKKVIAVNKKTSQTTELKSNVLTQFDKEIVIGEPLVEEVELNSNKLESYGCTSSSKKLKTKKVVDNKIKSKLSNLPKKLSESLVSESLFNRLDENVSCVGKVNECDEIQLKLRSTKAMDDCCKSVSKKIDVNNRTLKTIKIGNSELLTISKETDLIGASVDDIHKTNRVCISNSFVEKSLIAANESLKDKKLDEIIFSKDETYVRELSQKLQNIELHAAPVNDDQTDESNLKLGLESPIDFDIEASVLVFKDSNDDYKLDLDSVFKILDEENLEDDDQIIKHLLKELLIKVDVTANNDKGLKTNSHYIKETEVCGNICVESTLVNKADNLPFSLCNIVDNSNARIDGTVIKVCNSINEDIIPDPSSEQTRTSKWYNPVANLTKSERRLRKIKRGHGMSAEYKKSMKLLLKRNPQQQLIEAVHLIKMSETLISKFISCKSTSVLSPKLQKQFPRNESVIIRPKESSAASNDSTSNYSQRKSNNIENNDKFPKDKSHLRAMRNLYPRSLSHLPRIPKKVSATNSDQHVSKISNPTTEKVAESKNASLPSSLKISITKELKTVESSKEKPTEEVLLKVVPSNCTQILFDDSNRLAKDSSSNLKTENGWHELELDAFINIGEKHVDCQNQKTATVNMKSNTTTAASKLSRINDLVKINSTSTLSKAYDPFCGILNVQTCNDSNISCKYAQDETPTANCPDNLSIDPQVSDDELSILAPSDDSVISSEANVVDCNRNNVLLVPRSNYWFESNTIASLQDTSLLYREEIWEAMTSDESPENAWSDQDDAENKIDIESSKRYFFDQELSKLNLEELKKKLNLSIIVENFKKCLLVFEYMRKLISNLPIQDIEKLFAVANKFPDCTQENTLLFLDIVDNCLRSEKRILEKIKTLNSLLNWLANVRRATKDSYWKAIRCQVEFYSLVSLFNQVLAEGVNANHGSIIGVYRAGKVLQLSMDVSVIRALVSWFVNCDMWTLYGQDVYNLGCRLGIYNCLKIRKWPIVLFIRSYYTVGEIRIILLEFLLKLNNLLSTKFFIDSGVNFNEDFSLFIHFEELKYEDFSVVKINSITSMACSLSDVYEKFKKVLSTMGESTIGNTQVDHMKTILRIEKPLLEKLLNYAKVFSQAQKLKPFFDHEKPRLLNALAYKQLTSNSIYCRFDENPFI